MAKKLSEHYQIEGLSFELIRSARRKTLAIEVSPSKVKVRAPLKMREKIILDYVHSKAQWINHHLNSLPAQAEKLTLSDGAQLLYQGSIVTLQVAAGRNAPELRESLLDTPSSPILNTPITDSHLSEHQRLQNKLSKWYQLQASQVLEESVAFWFDQMYVSALPQTLRKAGLSAPSIQLRNYKKRWGCCFSNGKLSFNWRLIMAPNEVLNYVVVHELAHLQHMNHSKRFWNLVDKYYPNWRSQKDWLNKNGSQLYRW